MANDLFTFMDSLPNEPVSRDYREIYKNIAQSDAFKSAYENKSLGEVMSVEGEELVSEKKCMFTKDSYTDEDRKVLCKDCDEKCEYNKKEEPVSEEWIKELTTKLDSMSKEDFKKVFDKYAIDFNEEPVIEDLGDYINELSKQFPEVSFAKLSRIAVRVAKWQREHLWKPADGDDLPEIDREVIVLINYNAQCNIHDEEYPTYRVGFGHRPNPNGWDGKNIDTNVITHYTPKLYDKGCWNAPNIVYWLDARLPYEENKIIKEL